VRGRIGESPLDLFALRGRELRILRAGSGENLTVRAAHEVHDVHHGEAAQEGI